MAEYRFKVLGGYRAVVTLRAKLRNPAWVESRLMKGIGNILVAAAQRAFREQRFGEHEWKHRYPNQSEPYVNIAGVVNDFLMGKRSPPDRRFDRRPAGIDTGLTLRSLTPGRAVFAKGFEVVVGSTSPNADKIQRGGPSEQAITDVVKDRLRQWLKRERKATDKAGKEGGVFKTKKGERSQVRTTMGQAMRLAAMQKLGFLLSKKRTKLVTRMVPRPFIGITPDSQVKITDLIITTLSNEGTQGGVIVEGQ